LKKELTNHPVVQPHEDLHSVRTGLPFLGGRLPFGEAVTAHFAVPWDRFIMDEPAIPKPKRSPLCTGRHLVIREDCTHVADWVLKNSGRCEFVEVRTIERELQRTEY